MLNRKINPESFDQFLHAYQPTSDTPEHSPFPSPTPMSEVWVEPETGEILSAPPVHTPAQTTLNHQNLFQPKNINPMIKNSIKSLGIDHPLLPYLPWVVTFTIQLTLLWFVYNQSNSFELSLGQSMASIQDIPNKLNDQKDQLENLLEEIIFLNEQIESELIPASKSNPSEVVTIEKPIVKHATPKKSVRNSMPLLPIKYLGTAMRDENQQVLIESPTGVSFFRVGDLVFKTWRLSAIESQKLLLTTADGHQQIIPLTKIQP